ncbi:MAG: response regulator [Lachnospirales bacterium]
MFKLLIVDDEEVICNTIAELIDWESYNIKLIGTCKDGVEAYHTILDESPDIVMTDIKMPGISGLELIERINSRNIYTNFIILSGYSEFDYAKRAMKYGVRHYLIKPCDEQQIINCIKEIVEESSKVSINDSFLTNANLQYELTLNMIRQGAALSELPDEFFSQYDNFFNRKNTPYRYCCFYYVEKHNLENIVSIIEGYFFKIVPNMKIFQIYVHNVFFIFYPNFDIDYNQMDSFFNSITFEKQVTSIDYKREYFQDLKSLLVFIIKKLKRYELMYFIYNSQIIPYFNHNSVLQKVTELTNAIFTGYEEEKVFEISVEIKEIINGITSRDFLIQMANYFMINCAVKGVAYTVIDIEKFSYMLQGENEIDNIKKLIINNMQNIFKGRHEEEQYSVFIKKLITYINENLDDPNLTLKYICENYLYMNVNYVSRCFLKETREKFSSYLMNLRVEKAKEIIQTKNLEKIQDIAELVGCGNNPYYFSKIFKRCTNMTPTAYMKKVNKY